MFLFWKKGEMPSVAESKEVATRSGSEVLIKTIESSGLNENLQSYGVTKNGTMLRRKQTCSPVNEDQELADALGVSKALVERET